MDRLMASLGLFLLLAAPSLGEDWLQFRGPGGSGTSQETGLPSHWSQTENLRWKADLPGRGVSSPVIAGGRVYLTACTGISQDRLHVLCFDAASGKALWQRQFWATGNTMCHDKTCMAGPTPVTDGQRVYALFATGDLVCLDALGNLVWYRSLARDYPTIGNNVGMAASPILWKNVLLLPMENIGQSFVAGIDKQTGQNIWQQERARGINWVTPLVIHHHGQTEVLFQSSGELTAYDPQTGAKRWSYNKGGFANVASPVGADDRVLIAGDGILALRPGAAGMAPEVVWQSNKLRMDYTSPLYDQDRVYAINPAGVLNCADARDGKTLWQQRLKGKFWASPGAAEGRLYLVNEEGTTTIVQTGPEPRILGENPLGEAMLASPAIAEGAIFLR